MPEPSLDVNGEYEADSRNKNMQFNSQNNRDIKNRLGTKMNASNRNRSFSSFLSQQEAYGAFESLHNDGKGVNSSIVSRHNASVSSHNLSSFYSAN